MPPRGHDDSKILAEVGRLMAEDPKLKQRKAIIKVAGQDNLRRIEIKLKKLKDARKSVPPSKSDSLLHSVAAAHALKYPVEFVEGEDGVVLRVVAPAWDPSSHDEDGVQIEDEEDDDLAEDEDEDLVKNFDMDFDDGFDMAVGDVDKFDEAISVEDEFEEPSAIRKHVTHEELGLCNKPRLWTTTTILGINTKKMDHFGWFKPGLAGSYEVQKIPSGDPLSMHPLRPGFVHGNPIEAMYVLGLMQEVRDRVILEPKGMSMVAGRLGFALQEAWKEAGVAPDHTGWEAVRWETERLAESGLADICERISIEECRMAAAYASLGGGKFPSECIGVDGEERRAEMLCSMSSFAHLAFTSIDRGSVRTWYNRPVEMLAHHLENWIVPAIKLQRPVTVADAGWLYGLFGTKQIVPLSAPEIEMLLRYKAFVDPARILTSADAAGLLTLIEAIQRRFPYLKNGMESKLQVEILFERLENGVDASKSYGAVADELRTISHQLTREAYRPGDGDWADIPDFSHRHDKHMIEVVAAATLGQELLCRQVVLKVVIPFLVEQVAAAVDNTNKASAILLGHLSSGSLWRTRVEKIARDMTLGGRSMVQGARVVLACKEKLGIEEWPITHAVSYDEIEAAVEEWVSKAEGFGPVWREWEPLFVPRWGTGGREALADQFGELIRNVITSTQEDNVVGFGGSIRRFIRRVAP